MRLRVSMGKRKRGRPPLPEGERMEGERVYLRPDDWRWLERWLPGGNPSEQMRELFERARKFWPGGPSRFR